MSYKILRGSAQFKMGISNPAQLQDWMKENENVLGVCFTGRSNVGKSTLINSLFGKKTARTSKTPGRTREVNIFEFMLHDKKGPLNSVQKIFLFDLPGYGHADVSREMRRNWDELMSILFSALSQNAMIVNIQDCRHPDQKSDGEFHNFLKDIESPTTLIFNKIDKLKRQKDRAKLNKIKPDLISKYKHLKNIYFISAEKNSGVNELENTIVNHILDNIDK